MHGYGTLPFFEVWGINVQGDEELLGAAPTLLLGLDDSHEELRIRRYTSFLATNAGEL